MARIPINSGSDSGSDSTDTTAGDDDSQQNTRIGGRPAEGQQEVEGVFPQRDEEDLELDWSFDEESDLEETGILSAEDVRQSF